MKKINFLNTGINFLLYYILFNIIISLSKVFTYLSLYPNTTYWRSQLIQNEFSNAIKFTPLFIVFFLLGIGLLFILYKSKIINRTLLIFIGTLIFLILLFEYIFYVPFILTELPIACYSTSCGVKSSWWENLINILIYNPKNHYEYMNILISVTGAILSIVWIINKSIKKVYITFLLCLILVSFSVFMKDYRVVLERRNYERKQNEYKQTILSHVGALQPSYMPVFLKYKSDFHVQKDYMTDENLDIIITYYSCNENGKGNAAMIIKQVKLADLKDPSFNKLDNWLRASGWATSIGIVTYENITLDNIKAIYIEDYNNETGKGMAKIYFDTNDSRINIELNNTCLDKNRLKEEIINVANSMLTE